MQMIGVLDILLDWFSSLCEGIYQAGFIGEVGCFLSIAGINELRLI
jgi:hypothetical protein